MKRTAASLITFICLFTTAAFAQVSIKAELDKTSITADDSVTYKLTITSSEKNIPQPSLPKFTGFNVISRAQSSSIYFTKGNLKSVLVYVFVLSPVDTGKLRIMPSEIKIKNEKFSTDAFEIQVKQGKAKPRAKPEQKPPLPEEIHPEESEGPPQTTL